MSSLRFFSDLCSLDETCTYYVDNQISCEKRTLVGTSSVHRAGSLLGSAGSLLRLNSRMLLVTPTRLVKSFEL